MPEARPAQTLAGEARAEILTLGFGTSVAMWTLAYLSRLAPSLLPPPILFVLFILCWIVGGWFLGRRTDRGAGSGAVIGAIAALLNLLILGSVIGSDVPGQLQRAALMWVPASLVIGALLGALGAAWGRRGRSAGPSGAGALGWSGAFTSVTAFTTLLLLGAGGLVTSHEAGLAVVDWPNSFGYNMFLYPLSKMTGGIFYEHAHRLLGSLVGLCTLVLALHLQLSERRGWMKGLGWFALALVIVQGILGGLRVTGHFTTSQSAAEMSPSLGLAIVHGVTGQLFLGLLLAMAAFGSCTWRDATRAARSGAATDRQLAALLVLVVWAQLVLGALLRHLAIGMVWHVSFAMVVVLLAVAVGARNWGLYGDLPVLRPAGRALTILIGVQLLLGTVALVAVNSTPDPADIPAWEIAFTTLHQLTGATILGLAVLIAVWTRRLLEPAAD